MYYYALWIDHQTAMYCRFTPHGVEGAIRYATHETNHASFYHSVAEGLVDATQLVVMGPGDAKREFRHHCTSHHPLLAHAILDVLSMGGPPNWQRIVDKVLPYFAPHLPVDYQPYGAVPDDEEIPLATMDEGGPPRAATCAFGQDHARGGH